MTVHLEVIQKMQVMCRWDSRVLHSLTFPDPLQIPLFQAHPQLKQCVRQAIERAVQDLVHPVVDRSIKIAMTTCEQIVRKDFALDSEESRMRVAAHHMMRNLTAGMAMITCREPLLMSIATNLKNSFATALRVRAPSFEVCIQLMGL